MSAVRELYLQDRIAIVTGGCGGIGTAICERFVKEGATVYAADITSDEGALATGDEARYASGQLWIIDGGLTAQVQQMRL